MNPVRALAERFADRVHAHGDMLLHAQGLTVERLPWGRRRVSHPRLPALLDQRRLRALHAGLDAVDQALMDPATADLYAATARRAGIPVPANVQRAQARPVTGRAGGAVVVQTRAIARARS